MRLCVGGLPTSLRMAHTRALCPVDVAGGRASGLLQIPLTSFQNKGLHNAYCELAQNSYTASRCDVPTKISKRITAEPHLLP